MFLALFVIMFGITNAGNASAWAPDKGKAAAAAKRIFRFIETESKINAVEQDNDTKLIRLRPSEVEGKIEFRDVWFRYPTRTEDFVLRGMNITVNPSESVALVGESGCGKSTFVNLLMRFYDPDSGDIFLDGKNIKDINLHDLRRAISLVMQEPIIFNYTILENILYGKLDATNKEVLDSAKVSNCLEFIDKHQEINTSKIESAKDFIAEMEKNKKALIDLIGEKKFKEELELLELMRTKEGGKWDFESKQGDIDTRAENLKDIVLHDNFTEIKCGLRGTKLSGG